jgi:hypothetical protein
MNLEHEYIVKCTVNLRNSVASIDTVLNGLEQNLKEFGINEKFSYSSNFTMAIKTNRELTESEIYKMKISLAQSFIEVLPQCDIRVQSLESKSSGQPYNATNANRWQLVKP